MNCRGGTNRYRASLAENPAPCSVSQLDPIGRIDRAASLFPATPRQRCLVHKQRNVLNAVPRREQQEVATDLAGIWKQENRESALLNLAAFQAKYQKRYR